MEQELSSNKNLHNISDTTENDSILDFKSPKLQNRKAELNELFNYNIKRRMTGTKSKGSVKSHKDAKYKQHNSGKEKKGNLQKSQPSIESSFFKSESSSHDNKNDESDNIKNDNIMKEALVCPLCFKTFKELNSQAIHMKICAYKNNISTKKLLDAIELQKRQKNERKSLGLLAAPIVQERKKIVSRKINSHEESDLDLALALSKSLQEVDELNEINELKGLPRTLVRSVSEMVEPISEEQLERFGFASSKPPLLIKNKRKRDNQVTLLQTRSQDERNRILTERISEILMEDELITQNKKEKICDQKIKREVAPRSHLLKQFLHKENKLWNKASLSSNQECFYVSNLSEYIIPGEKQIETENETTLKFTNSCNLEDTNLNQYKTDICNNKEVLYDSSHRELNLVNEKCGKCQDKQFINTLVTNWENALNNSSASDVIIFVNDNKYIWAHKLVFYVQCPNILLDITSNNSSVHPKINEKISWTDIPYNIVLAFLEFIYCGIIKKYFSIFEELKNLSYLRSLARKYKVERLFDYLKMKEIGIKEVQAHNEKCSEFENELANSGRSNLQLNNCLNDLICGKSSQENISSSNANTSRYCSTSPDMFDDINDTIPKNQTAIELDKSKNSESLSIFGSIDEVRINNTDVNAMSSEKIKKYLNSISNGSYLPELEKKNNLVQTKSNLSLFIEQFRKENAKSDLDSDSENSILSIFSKPNRNPFNVRTDDTLDQHSSSCENAFVEETLSKKRRNVFSIFDNYTSPKVNARVLHEKNDASICHDFRIIQSVECNVENSTENQSKNNLRNKSISNIEAEHPSQMIQKNVEDMQHITADTSSILKYNENSIRSEISMNENEISMYSKYRQEHENNSILKYRDYIKKYVPQNDTVVDLEYENMDNNIILLSNINKDSEIKMNYLKQCETPTKRSSKKHRQVSARNSCDVTNEFFNKDKSDFPINDVSPISSRKSILEIQTTNNLTKLRYSKSENDVSMDVIRTSLLTSSTQPNMYECNSPKSPISVSSSTELDIDISNLYKSQQDKNDSISNVEKSLNNYSIERDIYLANVHINDEDDKNSISSSLSSIEDIDQLNKCNSVQTYNINKEVISSIITNDNIELEKKLSAKKQNDRKFKRKSVSETNLNVNTKNVINTNSLEKSQCKCHKKIARVVKSPVIIRDSITPPPNYNEMKTPELHEKLDRYGLKIQKRKKAVKLLTYIYNELHPIISTASRIETEFTNISSEDEEPPTKKINYNESDTNYINDSDCEVLFSPDNATSNHSQRTIINEEKQFDEPESITVADNTQNVKDMLLKFITANKVLYNKILAYEPLCIDSLHSLLKAEGFKCKMNTLMNFLDEQTQNTEKKKKADFNLIAGMCIKKEK